MKGAPRTPLLPSILTAAAALLACGTVPSSAFPAPPAYLSSPVGVGRGEAPPLRGIAAVMAARREGGKAQYAHDGYRGSPFEGNPILHAAMRGRTFSSPSPPPSLPVVSYRPSPRERAALHRESEFVGAWLGRGADVPLPVTSGPAGRSAHDFAASNIAPRDDVTARVDGETMKFRSSRHFAAVEEQEERPPAPRFHGVDDVRAAPLERVKLQRPRAADPLEAVFERGHAPALQRGPHAA